MSGTWQGTGAARKFVVNNDPIDRDRASFGLPVGKDAMRESAKLGQFDLREAELFGFDQTRGTLEIDAVLSANDLKTLRTYVDHEKARSASIGLSIGFCIGVAVISTSPWA